MKAVILLWVLCTPFTFLLGQNNAIKGSIVDEKNAAVPFATVVLKNSTDSSLYKGEIANENGEFIFQNIKANEYYLEIKMAGYKTTIKSAISIIDSLQTIDLGVLQVLQQSTELQSVTIAAEKPFIEKQADKTVVNIENSIIQNGSSAMEVLEKLPGVIVDQDGNIRLKGKQGVIILIDGKTSAMSGQDLANMLRGMTSSNIQKIEIITNPSAKYDASGNAGILNIIMKKNKREGYNGSVSANYGQGRYGKHSVSGSFNYKKNKLNLFSSYSYSNRKGFNNLTLNRKFYENDTLKTSYVTDNYIIFPFITHSPRVGLDYNVNKKTSVSFLAVSTLTTLNPSTTNHTNILGMYNEKLSSYDFTQQSKDKYFNYELNAQINHKFDTTGQDLTVNIDYGDYRNSNNQLFTTTLNDAENNNINTTYLIGKQIGSLSLYSIKADYTKPMKKDLTFDAGIKSSLVQSDKNMQFYNSINEAVTFDSARSSHFLYDENINAAYINFNKKYEKLSVQFGLRSEHTLAKGKQILNSKTFNRNYLQVFPTAYFDYKFNDKHGINMNLGRRIDRPGYEQMNPFKRLIDATTYSEGNPYLLPQLTYNAELSYSYKNELFTTFRYNITTDNLTDILIQDYNSKTTVQTIVNLNTLNYYSFDISYSKRMTKWWKTNSNFLTYFGKYAGTVNNYTINQGRPSFYISSNNTFNIVDGFSMECNLQYNFRNLYGVTWINTNYNLSLGIQKTILKKKGTITVNFSDIFWKSYPSGTTIFGNVNEDWVAKRDTRVLNVGFNYKFGKATLGKMRRNTGADDEKSRIQ
jgi:hypothetical protein